MHRLAVLPLILCAVLLAACGDSGSSSTATRTATVPQGTLGSAQATPQSGRFAGGNVDFLVKRVGEGHPTVEDVRYARVYGFPSATVSSGSFGPTCARQKINTILYQEYCITGSFSTPTEASGTVQVYQGAHGRTAANPSETHAWSVRLP